MRADRADIELAPRRLVWIRVRVQCHGPQCLGHVPVVVGRRGATVGRAGCGRIRRFRHLVGVHEVGMAVLALRASEQLFALLAVPV